MGEISTATVSGKSPRQMIGLRCVRTAGVRSTGKSAVAFLAVKSGRVASVASVSSVVASVQSAFRSGSGALRSAPRVDRRVSSSVVASSCPRDVGSVSGAGRPSPVALLGRVLRRVASVAVVSSPVASRLEASVGVASDVVASRPLALRSVASSSVGRVRGVGSVESSPRQVLRRVFEKLAETARDGLSRRLSRRFARVERQEECAAFGIRTPGNSGVAFVPVELRSSPSRRAALRREVACSPELSRPGELLRHGELRPSASRTVASQYESPAKAWRCH